MILRWMWRELRSPSLVIVWLSLSLAVACILSLGNINDRIKSGLTQQGQTVLAGDRALRATYPVDENWLTEAEKIGLIVSRQLTFSSMAFAGDQPILVQVKAVDDNYPLYGELKTTPDALFPMPGTVLVEESVKIQLQAQQNAAIDIGDAPLRIAGELNSEPDAGFNPFQIAPRVLINLADIKATGAIQPGSRLTYRYMFKGSPDALTRYDQFIKPQLKVDQRWQTADDSESTALSTSLSRAQSFLLLSIVLTLLLSGAAVTVAMNYYSQHRHSVIAILKTLGASSTTLRKIIVGQWAGLLLFSALLGTLIGFLFESILLVFLQPILPSTLPSASYYPWLYSMSVMFFMSLVVGLRPYKQLVATPPARVLRQDAVAIVWPFGLYWAIVSILIALLLAVVVGFNTLWWSLLLGIVALAALLGAMGWLSLVGLRYLTRERNLSSHLAINRLLRQPSFTISQIAAFSLSFMLLALLFMLQGNLLDRWQQQIPADSPNYFVMNVSPEQQTPLAQFFVQHNVSLGQIFPIVMARLTHINNQDVHTLISPESPGYSSISRELNLTQLSQPVPYNPITAGHWPPRGKEVSVDKEVAKQLNIKMNDKLTFTSNTTEFSVNATSFRHINWESLQPNFFFIFSDSVLGDLPQKGLSSFRYYGNAQLLADLNRQFPTLMLLDINQLLDQVASILRQVSESLESMVFMIILCGLLLLVAQVQVGMRQRQQELVIYRTLGANKGLLWRTLFAEFLFLGVTSGCIAVVGAEVTAILLHIYVFDFAWQPSVTLWIVLPLMSTLLLILVGCVLGGKLLRGNALYRTYLA